MLIEKSDEVTDKFSIKIFLVVCAAPPSPTQKDNSKFLVVDENNSLVFPYEYLSKNTTTRDIATKLLLEYTGVTLDWAILFPFGVVDNNENNDEIYVLYGVFIPDTVRLRRPDSLWKTYTELNNDEVTPRLTKKLAYEALWRQI